MFPCGIRQSPWLEAVVADDVERDEAAARAECLAEWRSDLEG
jgi:hypothetical protein